MQAENELVNCVQYVTQYYTCLILHVAQLLHLPSCLVLQCAVHRYLSANYSVCVSVL